MLGKRSRPAIGRLAGVLRSPGIFDPNPSPSPKSPSECKMGSPRGLKNYDLGGVGLGIAVALDKPSKATNGGEILANYAICGQFPRRSSPIPVNPSSKNKGAIIETDGLDEEFTYVTCHGPNKSVTTRVYYDNREYGHTKCSKIGGVARNLSVFDISPARGPEDRRCGDDLGFGSASDFLSSCHLCRKTLHGKDIYMYRGEKAFCSAECRQRQIGIDERREKCRSEASRPVSMSSSPCTYTSRGQIFSTGIVAV